MDVLFVCHAYAWHNMLLTSNAFLNSTPTSKLNFPYQISSKMAIISYTIPCPLFGFIIMFLVFLPSLDKIYPPDTFFLIFLLSLSCPGKYIFIFPTVYEKRSTFVRYSIFFTNIYFFLFFLYKTEYFTSSFIVDKQIQKDSLWSTLGHSFPTLSIWTEHSCKASKSPRRIFFLQIFAFFVRPTWVFTAKCVILDTS